ncbi:hypothetical protein SASPL_108802 [Salvia splendens]|uniref:Uncharacterized protein n=1 Tax=Salvia splendens TaxID=180675 RepID=A0A8X8YIS8_SALSN|nr:hypothetical protein SASPL_108802 [Salvia splendens]
MELMKRCTDSHIRLMGKSHVVQDELSRLGEQMVHSSEGKRALALELCCELDDKGLAGGVWLEVHWVLVDTVSASANATPGFGRYHPYKSKVDGMLLLHLLIDRQQREVVKTF